MNSTYVHVFLYTSHCSSSTLDTLSRGGEGEGEGEGEREGNECECPFALFEFSCLSSHGKEPQNILLQPSSTFL